MGSLDDLPQRDSNHDTCNAAETAFRLAIDSQKLFIVQREDRMDYGTDVQIEARDGSAMTNMRAHVQLKGTESSEGSDDSVRVVIARKNLNYLLAQADSVYVCYHVPTKRLLVRYAEDIYREYENRDSKWNHQAELTVRFAQPFDEKFQFHMNTRLLISGKIARDRRLQWGSAPPDSIKTLIQQTDPIDVPADPWQAKKILAEIYHAGNDVVISSSFVKFAAVLDSIPGAMNFAYMAEINLAISGASFDETRVRNGVRVLQDDLERGEAYSGSILYCVGNGWLALREYKKAREMYNTALLHLDDPEVGWMVPRCHMNMGSALAGLGEREAARVFYVRALELDPDLGEAHFALALWHRQDGHDLFLALEHLDSVVRKTDSSLHMSAVQGWRIDLLFRTGDADGAFREISNLLNEADQLDWIWPWCAKQVASFGRVSIETSLKALRFWRAYLLKHSEDISAERERLLCFWHLRAVEAPVEIDFEEFRNAVARLIESGAENPASLWNRVGQWAQYDKTWPVAETYYRKAYELEPERYRYGLGTALNFLKRYNEALQLFREESNLDAMSWFQIAVAREGVDDIEGGIVAYQHALDIDADYELAWFNLGGLYWNSHDIARATSIWLEAIERFPNHSLAVKLNREWPFLFYVDHDDENESE